MIRLNKFIARNGFASRRGADELIGQGRVKVNGLVVKELGIAIDPQRDEVNVDGRIVEERSEGFVYIALNKPRGYTTTVRDKFAKQIVMELVPKIAGLVPVGRLDRDSEGLLLFSNDGDFVQQLTHPGHEIKKWYMVEVEGVITEEGVQKLCEGVVLREGVAKADVKVWNKVREGAVLEFVLSQGWNRQIRRMCGALGWEVRGLKRVKIGGLSLGDLKTGEMRFVKKEQVLKV
ncbi:MAG: RNA pseudouridine synthase [Patescibacteria group bacterium]|nr:MAG: RNA pseudouridine synthase [Patescibacteria group bacterium]